MKKVIIVDDEDSARALVKEYLQEYEDFILIEECNNGVDAVKVINTFKPDLVFMDIQMPGLNGFEVLCYLEQMPKVIFSTAYDNYALEAFEVHALDYLLKPYTHERFAAAMKKAIGSTNDYGLKINELVQSLNKKEDYLENVLVSSNKKLISIQVNDIIWIEANGDYAKVIVQDHYYLSNYGITQLEQKMKPQTFARVHRSAIINVNKVKEVYKYTSGYEVIMVNGDNVKVSRSYLEKIRNLIL